MESSQSPTAAAAEPRCSWCAQPLERNATVCPQCSRRMVNAPKSDVLAGVFGLLFGPVGLWYKRRYAAGFAWLGGTVAAAMVLGPLMQTVAPFLWIGQAVHAVRAKPREPRP